MHNAECFQNHLGLYAVEPTWFTSAVAAVKDGTWKPLALGADDDSTPPYVVSADGLAVLSVTGPIMRARSKFGGASSIALRQALRAAVADDKVSAIMLRIDSPGGTVAGTPELAAEIRATDSKKPVYAHIDDLGASAAYWIAAQARRVTANATAQIGSIGVFTVVKDTSKAAEMAGVKVHVISTGEYKGGADGAPVSDAQLAEVQKLVNEINEFFMAAVVEGRAMDKKDVKAVADGRMFLAAEAKRLGLIDAVASMDEVVSGYGEKIRQRKKMRAEQARLGLAIAAVEAQL